MATLAEKRAARAAKESENVGTSDDNQRAGSGAGAASGAADSPTDAGVRDTIGVAGDRVSPDGGNRGDASGPGDDAPNAARGNDAGNRNPERITIADGSDSERGRGDSSRGGGGSSFSGFVGDFLGGRGARGGDAGSSAGSKPAGKRGKTPRLVVTDPDPRIVAMIENGLTFATGVLASLRPPPLNELWTIAPAEVHAMAEPAASILQNMPEEWIAAVERGSPYAALGVAVFSVVYPRVLQERQFWANVRAQQRQQHGQPGAPVGGSGFHADSNGRGVSSDNAGSGSADPLSMFQ